MATTKVLVVDDSAFMRKMLTEIINSDDSLQVVGTARNGEDALRQAGVLLPDVLTLDVEMPVMDGYATLVELMKIRPTPVVMVSSMTQAGADITMKCLAAGAVDFVAKPSGSISLDISLVEDQIVSKIKIAAASRPRREAPPVPRPATESWRRAAPRSFAAPTHETIPDRRGATLSRSALRGGVLVIGASTGGPRALQTVVQGLDPHLGIPVIIVQHMPAGFTASLARRLDSSTPLTVREACEHDVLCPGTILVAPGGHHVVVDSQRRVHLDDGPAVHGVRPSVDVTLESVSRSIGGEAIVVLLTGMGKDGAGGMKMLHEMGSHTFAEDESTCVVYGMPKAAVEIGAVDEVLPLGDIAAAVSEVARRSHRAAA